VTDRIDDRQFNLKHSGTYLGVAMLWCLSKCPRRWWPSLTQGLGRGLQRLVPSRNAVVMRNLELAFPAQSLQWREEICAQSYQRLALSVFETAKLWFADPAWLDDYIDFDGLDHLRGCQQRGEPVLLVSCHFTSIEVAGQALSRLVPFYPIYGAAKNPVFDRIQREKRLRFSPDVVKSEDMRKAMRVLRNSGTLWILPDHSVSKSQGGVSTTFFDQPVLSTSGPSRLQRRTDAKVVMFSLRREQGKLIIVLEAPSSDLSEDSAEAAQQLNSRFEAAIRESPADYFWHHKRFKSADPTLNPYA